MHLKILFVLGLSLGLLAADVTLVDEYHGASEDLNGRLYLAILEKRNHSSHGHASSFSKDDARQTTISITSSTLSPSLKTLISSPAEIVTALIPTIRKNPKNTTKDSPASSQHSDKSKNFYGTFPNSTSEPNTTLEDISSKFDVHELTTSLFSNDSTTSLVTPSIGGGIIQLESSDKESVNNSSEMATPLNIFQFPANFKKIKNDTTVKSFESPEDIDAYEIKELSINATTPRGQNEGNLDLSLSKRQNKSASIDNQQQGANFLSNSVITAPLTSSTSNTPTSAIVSEFPDLPINTLLSHDLNITAAENVASNNPNFQLKTEIATELPFTTLSNHQILYENSSKLADLDIILIENRTDLFKEGDEYAITVPKICKNYSTISRLLHLLNSAPNNQRTTNFTCDTLKNMKIMIKSKDLMDSIREFLKEESKTDEMVSIKVLPNSTIDFELFSQSPSDEEGIFISYLQIIIFSNVMLIIIVALCGGMLYKKRCRRHSTSLNLHHIPRLNLKTDYNLTPIPRPSISFPDGNRDFLHAYAQDNHNRSRQDNTPNKRNSSDNMAKTYEEVDKEIGSKQEMQTFTMSSGRKSEFRTSASQDYASPHSSSWDRLHENNYPRKYGVDNPGYRKW